MGAFVRTNVISFHSDDAFCFVGSLINALVNVNSERIDKAFITEYNICEVGNGATSTACSWRYFSIHSSLVVLGLSLAMAGRGDRFFLSISVSYLMRHPYFPGR